MAKNKNAVAKKYTKMAPLFQSGEMRYHTYEYKMGKECAYDILHDPITGKKLPGDASTLLCDYVNEQSGILGTCVAVIVG